MPCLFSFSFFDLGRESVARVEGRALCHQSDQLRCFVENFSCKAKKVKEEIKLKKASLYCEGDVETFVTAGIKSFVHDCDSCVRVCVHFFRSLFLKCV